MIKLFSFLLTLSMFVGANAQATENFHDWKSGKVQQAQTELNTLMSKQIGTENTKEKKLNAPFKDLSQGLDQALDLSIHDYFNDYLKHLSDREFKRAVSQLSLNDNYELLSSYKNTATQSSNVPLATVKATATDKKD